MPIRRENYINIQGWMITDLMLKGNDLLIYAIIYGFTQDGEQWFEGSRQYLADWCNSTKRGISKNLESLVSLEYIIKDEYVVNNVKFCKYRANLDKITPVNKVPHPGEQSSPPPGEQSSPNNIYINNIDNNKEKSIKEKVDSGKQSFPPPPTEKKESVTCQKVVDSFNKTCTSLPQVRSLTDKRKRAIKLILKKYSLKKLEMVFKKVEESSFLNGSSDKWSGATFDWLLKESNFIKVLEGNYDDKGKYNNFHSIPSYDIEEYEKNDNYENYLNNFVDKRST